MNEIDLSLSLLKLAESTCGWLDGLQNRTHSSLERSGVNMNSRLTYSHIGVPSPNTYTSAMLICTIECTEIIIFIVKSMDKVC